MSKGKDLEIPTGTQRGTVVWFREDKGFGFIRPDGKTVDDKADVFVHYTGIDSRAQRRNLQPDQIVEFEVVDHPKGKLATNVRVTA